MVYCVKYFKDSSWSICRLPDFVEALLFATRNSNHFQIWHQNTKKLTDKTLVAYSGEIN